MKPIKLVAAILETIMAIPILGWVIWIYTFGMIGFIELCFGVLGLVNHPERKGSVLQIMAGVLGWIPVVGWVLHIISAIFLYIEALKGDEE